MLAALVSAVFFATTFLTTPALAAPQARTSAQSTNRVLYDDSQGFLHLKVYALVTHPTVPDAINKEFATMKWRAFAHILGMHLE
ncbi:MULTISPECIES: hypothetical protein [unclassified Streptomyces]|uniref:hypothetical protein n=1 Tax=unclassified Streptomyces TaxID=2593676 RepID=UPI003326E94C